MNTELLIWIDQTVKIEDAKETYFLGVDRTSPPSDLDNVVGYEKLDAKALPYICGPMRWKRKLYKRKTANGN